LKGEIDLKKVLATAFVSVFIFAFAPAYGALAADTLTLTPKADTYARSRDDYVDVALGAEKVGADRLNIAWRNTNDVEFESWIYLKFDVKGLMGRKIEKATVTFTVHTAESPGKTGFKVYKYTNEWNENTLTWNNMPKAETSKSYGEYIPKGLAEKGSQISFDIDPSFFDLGAATYSMALITNKATTELGLDSAFYSKDAGNDKGPVLTLTLSQTAQQKEEFLNNDNAPKEEAGQAIETKEEVIPEPKDNGEVIFYTDHTRYIYVAAILLVLAAAGGAYIYITSKKNRKAGL
jgi:hypothetical protein